MLTTEQSGIAPVSPQYTENFRQRLEAIMGALGTMDDETRKYVMAKAASDAINSPANTQAVIDALYKAPFWGRLKWHAEAGLVNFGVFLLGGSAVAYVAGKVAGKKIADEIQTGDNPFASTESVEATNRGSKRRDSHIHAAQ